MSESNNKQQLSNSPSKWVEEVEANPSLLTQTASSAIICRGLEQASTPILQKRLWKVVKQNISQMVTSAGGCQIIAALVKTGTVKIAAFALKDVMECSEFKSVISSSSASAASPSTKKPAGKKSKAAASPAKSSTTNSAIDIDAVELIAPIVSAAAFRIDVQPERNDFLAPISSTIVSALQQYSSQESNANISLPIEGGLLEIVFALLSEKDGQIGNAFVDQIVGGSAVTAWTNQIIRLSVDAAKRDSNAIKTITKMIAAAQESAVLARNQEVASDEEQQEKAERATKIAHLFWAQVRKSKSKEPASIRIPFLSAVIPHQKNNSVASDVANFVAKERQDIVSVCLTNASTAKSELVALLLNHSTDAAAKTLAQAVIKSVSSWTALIANTQLPQVTLSCFLALRQIAQKFPSELVVSNEMTTVLDAATRHFLKQTLSAAESAKLAVKLRLSSSSQNNNNNNAEKPKMLTVVDSDDDETSASSPKTAGVRRQRAASSDGKPSPKNSAKKVAKK